MPPMYRSDNNHIYVFDIENNAQIAEYHVEDEDILPWFENQIETIEAEKLAKIKASITAEEVEKEIAEDMLRYDFNDDVVPSEYEIVYVSTFAAVDVFAIVVIPRPAAPFEPSLPSVT